MSSTAFDTDSTHEFAVISRSGEVQTVRRVDVRRWMRWATWRGRVQGALLVLLAVVLGRWALMGFGVAFGLFFTAMLLWGLGRTVRHRLRRGQVRQHLHRTSHGAALPEPTAHEVHQAAAYPVRAARPLPVQKKAPVVDEERSALDDFDRRLEEALQVSPVSTSAS